MRPKKQTKTTTTKFPYDLSHAMYLLERLKLVFVFPSKSPT